PLWSYGSTLLCIPRIKTKQGKAAFTLSYSRVLRLDQSAEHGEEAAWSQMCPAWVQSGPERPQAELMRLRVMDFASYLKIFPEDLDFVHLVLEAEFLGRGWLDAPPSLSAGGPFAPLHEAVSATGSSEPQLATAGSSKPQPAAARSPEPQPAAARSPRHVPEEPVGGLPPLPSHVPEGPVGGLPPLPRHVLEEPVGGMPPLPRHVPEEPVGWLPPLPRLVPEEPMGELPPRPGPEHLLGFLWGVLMELMPDFRPPDTTPDSTTPDEASLDSTSADTTSDDRKPDTSDDPKPDTT
ncbi:hypothetical protein AMECASPLE_013304, partial [Ameca splendens]